MKSRSKLQREALAFRIWRLAEAKAWNLDCRDIAARLKVSRQAVVEICAARGWLYRLRTNLHDYDVYHELRNVRLPRVTLEPFQ